MNFKLSPSEQPGFQRLSDAPAEWIRVSTALIDYICFVSNSELQAAYTTAKSSLLSIRIGDFISVTAFGDKEIQLFNIFDSYANSTQRSSIDMLDRGHNILCNLPTLIRKELDTDCRRYGIVENCMDRDWVINELLRLETRDNIQFSFWTKSKSTHPKPDQPTLATMSTVSNTSDTVEIKCQNKISPNCEKVCTTNPAYWKSKSWDVPKNCLECRKLKRLNANNATSNAKDPASMLVSMAVSINDPDLSDDDGYYGKYESDSDEHAVASEDYLVGYTMGN